MKYLFPLIILLVISCAKHEQIEVSVKNNSSLTLEYFEFTSPKEYLNDEDYKFDKIKPNETSETQLVNKGTAWLFSYQFSGYYENIPSDEGISMPGSGTFEISQNGNSSTIVFVED